MQTLRNIAGAIHPFIVWWRATKSLGGALTERKIRFHNASKLWQCYVKHFYISKNLSSMGMLVQNVKTISQESSSSDHLLSVVKMSYLISIKNQYCSTIEQ